MERELKRMEDSNTEPKFDTYIGTKIIRAKRRIRSDGVDGYQVVYENGYVSWSPKGVFERSYRKLSDEEKAMAASGPT
jgi:hypothetical protein